MAWWFHALLLLVAVPGALGITVTTKTDPPYKLIVHANETDSIITRLLASQLPFTQHESSSASSLKRLLSLVNNRGVVVEVGAHIGSTALYCAALGVHVIAIEPEPDHFRKLRSGIKANGFEKLVTPKNVALTNSVQAGVGHSCIQTPPTDASRSVLGGIDSSLFENACTKVKLSTLDEVVAQKSAWVQNAGGVFAIHSDTLSYEHHVLLGASNLLATAPPCAILLTLSPQRLVSAGIDSGRLITWLAERGYAMHLAGEHLFDPIPLQLYSEVLQRAVQVGGLSLVFVKHPFTDCAQRFVDSPIQNPFTNPLGEEELRKALQSTPPQSSNQQQQQHDTVPLHHAPQQPRNPTAAKSNLPKNVQQNLNSQARPIYPIPGLNIEFADVTPLFMYVPHLPLPTVTPPPMLPRKHLTNQRSRNHVKLLFAGFVISTFLLLRGFMA